MSTIKQYLKHPSTSGILLFLVALLAFILDNTSLSTLYNHVLHLKVGIDWHILHLNLSLIHWINDGLMALFFLLVGLEIKREMINGDLVNIKTILLPLIAAFGGMLFPALIFAALNWHNPLSLRGWAIPTATDIAFSLALLSILGSRIPKNLKIFLTALAIFDDIGAIAVIAIFYTKHLNSTMLMIALGLAGILFLCNKLNIKQSWPYAILGTAMWLSVMQSGIHATLAGILLATTIPIKKTDKTNQPNHSLLYRWEHALHPWVGFLVLPLFAFANAGVNLSKLNANDWWHPITWGCLLGLFLGKQLGIWGCSKAAIKLGWAHNMPGLDNKYLYGLSLIAGIGFTMSLFIAHLAFHDINGNMMLQARLGIISGSLISAILGYLVIHYHSKKLACIKN